MVSCIARARQKRKRPGHRLRAQFQSSNFGTRIRVAESCQHKNDNDLIFSGRHRVCAGICVIDDVNPDDGELTASFDGRTVTYGFGELDTLVPAYAATIHKSQGSEYPAVVIPVMTQHYPMLQRNLLYTGVTRGKKLVVIVGQKKAVAIAVRNVSGRRRWSKLKEWLTKITR